MRGKGKKKKKKNKKKKKKGKDNGMKLGVSHLLFLPEDILVLEILERLPAVDIISCTSVCKQWYSIIQTHWEKMQVVHHYCHTRRRHVLSYGSDPESLEVCHTVPFSCLSPDSVIILGSTHGLFCLVQVNEHRPRDGELYCIWSPSVGRNILLSSPMSVADGFGFGFDDMNKDYKVVVLAYLTDSNPLNCQLFSLKKGSWSTVSTGKYAECFLVSIRGCFVNEALHWMALEYRNEDLNNFRLFVLAFNIAHENFEEIELPRERHSSHHHSLLEIKGSLACFNCGPFYPIEEPQGVNSYSMWVMKEYGVTNSWVKMWTFDQMGTFSWVHGLWGNGDEILVEMEDDNGDKDLFLYDTKTHISRDFGGDAKPHIHSICGYPSRLIFHETGSGAVSY